MVGQELPSSFLESPDDASGQDASPEADFLLCLQAGRLTLNVFGSQSLLSWSEWPAMAETLHEPLEKLLTNFIEIATEAHIPDHLSLLSNQDSEWEVDLTWVTNPEIQAINAAYREKDTATDVLSFPLLTPALVAEAPHLAQLPTVALGTIFISVDWALEAHSQVSLSEGLPCEVVRYLLERLVHGCLHLMGQHHDTMETYQQVVALQGRILDATL
jgi:probable rRNA maturation factor